MGPSLSCLCSKIAFTIQTKLFMGRDESFLHIPIMPFTMKLVLFSTTTFQVIKVAVKILS